jgi:dUTP pyrophosphatase|tara:strand:+ start:42 stop:494 length:453 start_codon:yes stop_codon:yes gene_type:complete
MILPVEMVILNPDVEKYGLPKWATTGSAGMDLRALKDAELYPGDQEEFSLGFSISLPFGSFGLLAPRSSLGIQRIHLSNLVGIIDSDYQGELVVNLTNNSRHPEPFKIKAGDRIAQLVVLPFCHADWDIVTKFSNESDRGDGGFGSTGVD